MSSVDVQELIAEPVAVSLPVSRTRFRYGFTIFCGAFLLFQVQLILGKYILPWFGGTPAVWTTCMLFFQLLLLGGYLYAHFLSSKLSARTQAIVHIAVLSVSAFGNRIGGRVLENAASARPIVAPDVL